MLITKERWQTGYWVTLQIQITQLKRASRGVQTTPSFLFYKHLYPSPTLTGKKLMRITYFNEYFKNIIELDIYLDIYNSILVVHDEKMHEILNI